MPIHKGLRAAPRLTRVLVGLVLLGAAALKAHQLATSPVPGEGLLSTRWLLTLWVEVEIVLGVWLVSGLAARRAWQAAVGCFVVFAVVTFVKAVRGDASCGCFGRVDVNPWVTLVLDVAALAALVRFRPSPEETGLSPAVRRRRLRMAAASGAAMGLAALIGSVVYAPATLSEEGQVVGDSRIVLLEPRKWVGAPCPLLKHTDVARPLAKGRWTVVLYHHDCPRCEERVPEFARRAREQASRMAKAKVAMIELPPHAPAGRSLLPPETPCLTGKVDAGRDWFVATPTVLTLSEGVVIDARVGDAGGGRIAAGPAPLPGEEPVALQPDGYDFGFVKPRAVRKVLLAVPNASEAAVRVTQVRSECACMAAVTSEAPTPPGETLRVRVVLRAPKKRQQYDKRILLQTDDPARPLVPIRIRAAVGEALQPEPRRVDFGRVAAGRRREQPVVLVNHLDRPVRLVYSTSSGSGCFAKVPRDPVPAGGRLSVPLVVTGRGEGRQEVTVRIQTDLDFQPSVPVRVAFDVTRVGGAARQAAARPQAQKESAR